jgi:hypothetical protein
MSCEAIMTQGIGTIAALTRWLLVSRVWFFWWD